ncbi:MAG: efflux RND transporter periplasmic adaptor subunit [Comamonadaceae bacterium]
MNISSKTKSRLLLTFLGVALIAAMAFVVLRSGPLAPTRITVVQVKEGSFEPALFGIGTVEARRSWMIGPTVAGRVLSVKVDVGDMVKAGQLLAEMDPVDIDQRLASFDASLERARSAHAAALAQQADAKARRELALSNMRRNQDLADKDFISAGALESRSQEKLSADAAVEAASANALGAAQDMDRIKADRAALMQQRANVRLIAPADGVVSARDAEAGSTVVAGQSVLRLIDPASLWIKLRVDQGRSAGLAPGLKARIVLRSRPQLAIPGRVARVELLSDSVTEERVAQVALDEAPAGLSVGEMAEVTLQLPSSPRSPLVPSASIQRQGSVTGVWKMESGKPTFAPVRIGSSSLEGQVQILDGIKPGDEVVVYSQKALSAGSRVQVVDSLVRPVNASGVNP